MRAANNAIARVASLVAGLLYGIGGCVLGALWLLRKRALLWRQALVAGMVVAGLNALAMPRQCAAGVVRLRHRAIRMGVLGPAGRRRAADPDRRRRSRWRWCSWPRRACRAARFRDHPQLWRLWSRDAAPTSAVLGRTLGGYLFVPIELALIVAFYFVTNRYFGWWQPSESLSDPNILGSAVPGLAPIGMALQAGFMEECLFRAVPLSLAALIGARFGHRRLLIGMALVLQAVMFGAAHANYPGFPAYSRLVELIVPSMIWGLIFLRFGLLPTIILHALFDLVLMSMPVFLVEGPSAAANQALVIAAGLVPLGHRAVAPRAGRRVARLPASLRNGAWRRVEAAEARRQRRERARRGRRLDGAHAARAAGARRWSGVLTFALAAISTAMRRRWPSIARKPRQSPMAR